VTRPLRFGLVGTGYWARITHAPALASTDGIEFAAVWGRNADAAADLAAHYDVTACHDLRRAAPGRRAPARPVTPQRRDSSAGSVVSGSGADAGSSLSNIRTAKMATMITATTAKKAM
jgi:hypothetical protein